MRCQVGDLVRIVSSEFGENLGGLVEVVSQSRVGPGWWDCRGLQSLRARNVMLGVVQWKQPGFIARIHDDRLEPLRGEPRAEGKPEARPVFEFSEEQG